MLIEVTSRNVSVSEEQQEWVLRRVQFALGRFVSRIRRVSVIFSDVNGDRGGEDKKCRLRISMIPSGEVIVEDVDASIESVVANVTERASRSVARAVERRSDHSGGVERVIQVSRLISSRS